MEVVLKNIYFEYKDRLIFDNLNVKFNSNSITGIIGHNNSGKSTLLNIISGKIRPSSGDISNINSISFLPSDKYINFNKTPYQILNVNNKLFSIEDILKIVNLDENKINIKLKLLSDSEIKKVLIGYILIQDKDLYLFDSPNNILDYKTKSLFIKFLRTLKVRYGKTIILTSNDIDFIHEVSDDVLLLVKDGIINDKYSIFTNEELMNKYNFDIPKIIDISNIVYKNKNIKMGYRDDIKDLIKDIYRYAK